MENTLRKFVASVSAIALFLSLIIVPGMGINSAQAALNDEEQVLVDAVLDITGVDTEEGFLTRYQAAEILAGADYCEDDIDSGLDGVAPSYEGVVNCVVAAGYFKGTADGTFEGDREIHRDEWAAVSTRYAGIEDLPGAESLKLTLERVRPCWDNVIAPDLKAGKDVLIAAHGNSLRALVKMLDRISDEEITGFNIPTGVPLAYELDDDLQPLSREFLGDPEEIAKAAAAVAAQGKAK